MLDINQPAEFLAYAGDTPFLVRWSPGVSGAGVMVFQVADPDFRFAWAQEPERRSFRLEHVAYYGLHEFARRYASMAQDAHAAELDFEAQAGDADQ